TGYDALLAAIESWKQQYLLRSGSPGIVTFGKFWSRNQQINAGDRVFGIVSENRGDIIGKLQLASEGAGKVKTGQRVHIKVDGYPYMEYGMLEAKVQSISLVPDEKLYSVQLSLPKGMTTFYGKTIDFTGELSGTAEIATDEMSLFQRLMSPLKYFFKKNT
ncbi:MAG: HlyD family secretion protein, partial [Prevotellaceae bacterium]|nr:HlyD family secretion protein [Prevotellaceae bacterium]